MADRSPTPDLANESRYQLFDEIAAGGMATVHIGRLTGAVGFARTVAIKRMHPHLARDSDFVSMFVDEARLAARIRHPNVVATLDVVRVGEGELLLVMEYVHGEALSGLMRAASERGERIPPTIAVAVTSGALFGLHAAHEATDERGARLEIVHRDVTPANILVGVDGIARVLDFGIATANVRVQTTREGQMKGKLRYMAPEQLKDEPVTRRTDVYAASMLLWEVLTGERLFAASNEGAVMTKVLESVVVPPSRVMDDVPRTVDAVVMRGLSRDPAARFASAREMALALERALPPAPAHAVGDWVERTMGDALRSRAERIARIEAVAEGEPAPASVPRYEVTVSHTFTASDPGPAAPAMRTRSLITSAASPVALSLAAPTQLPSASPPRRTSTERLPALNVPPSTVLPSTAAAQRTADEATVRAQRRRTRVLAAAALALSAATTLLVGLVIVTSGGHETPPDPSAARPPEASLAAPPVGASSTAPLPPPLEPEQQAGEPTTSSTPSVPPRRPPRAASSAASSKPNCNPPYVEDANGRRRVKRECL